MKSVESAKRVYLDTSAYLAILLGEANGASLLKGLKGLKGSLLCSSALLLIESERSLVHLVRHGRLSQKNYESAFAQLREDRETFVLRDFTVDLCLSRDFPPVRTPRSSDLIHLRTAKWFMENGGLARFYSLDQDQLKAADEFGLPVVF